MSRCRSGTAGTASNRLQRRQSCRSGYVRFPALHAHSAQVLQVILGTAEVLLQHLGRYMPSLDLRYCSPFIGGVPVQQYLPRRWFGFQVLLSDARSRHAP